MKHLRSLGALLVSGGLLSVACGPAIQAPTLGLTPVTATAILAPPSPAPVPSETLLIVAASDLQFALPEMAQRYEAQGRRKPAISLGSTGNFATQIENGAPADLFFAADQSFLNGLDKKDFVLAGSRRVYATGRIVLTAARTAPFEPRSLEDLLRPELKKIAIANPEHAPYGRAAKAALETKGLWSQIEPKVVLGDNISQTFQFVQTGNAEAGIVALSVALGVPGTPYTLIDAALHPPLTQEAAILKRSKQPEAARDFLNFVSGTEGRLIMKKYGFALPGGE